TKIEQRARILYKPLYDQTRNRLRRRHVCTAWWRSISCGHIRNDDLASSGTVSESVRGSAARCTSRAASGRGIDGHRIPVSDAFLHRDRYGAADTAGAAANLLSLAAGQLAESAPGTEKRSVAGRH